MRIVILLGSATLNGGRVFLLKIIIFSPSNFVFSPLPDTSGRGWGWGFLYLPPLNAVLPESGDSQRLFKSSFSHLRGCEYQPLSISTEQTEADDFEYKGW